MTSPVIVFDFDKTLTEKDTIFGFYRYIASHSRLFRLKQLLLLVVAVLAKLRVASNTTLKRVGVILFLRGLEKEYLQKAAAAYASQVEMNEIYYTDFLVYPVEYVHVISASYEIYLRPLFPDHKVVGSKLAFDGSSRVIDISINMYGNSKREWLKSSGIEKIDVLYTDSLSDKPLMEISEKVFLVRDGEKKELKQ